MFRFLIFLILFGIGIALAVFLILRYVVAPANRIKTEENKLHDKWEKSWEPKDDSKEN